MRPPSRSGLLAAVPLGWLALFFVGPLFIVLRVSLSQSALSQPPYTPLFALRDLVHPDVLWDKLGSLSFAAYGGLISDPLYLVAFGTALMTAATATMLTLAVAYPFALAIARAPARRRAVLLLLAVAPFWTSFLVRIYAWVLITKDDGLLNTALLHLGIIGSPLPIYATQAAVIIGIVYAYLPFMVLPITAALDRQDVALRDAAADLGASPWRSFLHVTLPLSRNGVLAGCAVVFIPALGEFVIPDLLGGSDTVMIGNTIWTDFFSNRDWPTASATAIVLLLLLVGPILIFERGRA